MNLITSSIFHQHFLFKQHEKILLQCITCQFLEQRDFFTNENGCYYFVLRSYKLEFWDNLKKDTFGTSTD